MANDRDPAFAAVAALRAASGARPGAWVTTDYVWMKRSHGCLPPRQGLLDIECIHPERFRRAWRLRLQYHDKPRISFTDLSSFVVMRELRIGSVISGDAHFEQA